MINDFNENYKLSISRRQFLKLAAVSGVGASLSMGSFKLSAMTNVKRPICVFSKHLQFLDYTNMAKVAGEIGFDGVDLTVRPGGHVLPENVERDLPKAVKAVESAGLKVNMMTTRITSADDPSTEKILRLADKYDIRYYRMGYLPYKDNMSVEESLDFYQSQFEKLENLNRKYNVHGAYQNHAGTRIGGPVWDLWVLLKDRDPRYLGVQYDIRHATVEGGNSWPVGMNLLAPWTKITAIKDFYWYKENNEWDVQNCPLGEGMVEFNRYFDIYNQRNIQGPISLHYEYNMPGDDIAKEDRIMKTKQIMKKDLKALQSMVANNG